MKKFYAVGLVFALSFALGMPHSTQAEEQAQPEHVFISEINWAGSPASKADEWVELANPTSETVDLSGWILTGAATSGDALSFEEGFSLESGTVAVVSNYPEGHEKTTLSIAPSLVTSSLSLSNTSLEILLVTPDGMVVDEILADYQTGSSEPYISMVRVDDATWASSSESMNLMDSSQLGSPGQHVFVDQETAVTEAETEPEPDTSDPETDSELEHSADPILKDDDCHHEHEQIPETEVTDSNPVEENTVCDCDADDQQPDEESSTASEEEPTEIESEQVSEPEPQTEPAPESEPEPEPNALEEVAEIVSYHSEDVLLNEIVSDPEDGTEWVEILNNSDQAINLLDWGVMDASGKLTTFPNVVLAPGEFYIVDDPAGNLNNSGDDIHLFDPSGFVVDEISYGNDLIGSPKKGESLSRFEEEWMLTTVITKEKENKLPELDTNESNAPDSITDDYDSSSTEPTIETADNETEQESVPSNIEEVPTDDAHTSPEQETHKVVAVATQAKTETSSVIDEDEPESTGTTLTGVITALPGTFGKQIAFMSGVQLYFYHADWPALQLGDIVRVVGETSESRGEKRLKIASQDDISIIGSQSLSPKSMMTAQALAAEAGSLVTIEGEIVELEQDRLILEDQDGQITVIAHANSGIHLSNLSGSRISITGVLRRFGEDVRLYPRSQSDISVLTEDTAPGPEEELLPVAKTQSAYPWIGGGLATSSIGVLAYWYIRNKRETRLGNMPALNNSAT